MGVSAQPCDRFIRRVHRRFIVLRTTERLGLGLLGGCCAALPLLAVALWRGLPPWPLACSALSLGAAAGLVWGLIARPTLLAAAIEADRQLEWSDLLSSALAVQNRSSRDAWASAVLAAADARCRSTSPGSVILNRLGARAWGGIGLAAALVVVVGLLPTYAVPARAGDAASAAAAPSAFPESRPAIGQSLSAPSQHSGPPRQDPEDLHASKMIGAEAPDPASHSDSAASSGPDHLASNSAGRGAGASHSNTPEARRPDVPTGATHARSDSSAGPGAGGAGESAGGHAAAEPSGQAAGATASASRTPPWQAAGWPADSKRALHAVNAGEVPDAYRDLVRGYFDRP